MSKIEVLCYTMFVSKYFYAKDRNNSKFKKENMQMKRKQLLAMLLATAMLTSSIVSPIGNLTVKATEVETVENETEYANVEAEIVNSGSCGENVTYTLDSNGCLFISGEGKFDSKKIFWNNTDIKNVVIEEGITTIADEVFSGCSNLKSVVLPEGIESIGKEAFANCHTLTDMVIPESVTNIGEKAFFGTRSLTEVIIPKGVTTIADGAFWGCGFTKITIPEGVTTIGEKAFARSGLIEVVFPKTVTSIGNGTFWECENLLRVEIPKEVKTMGSVLFEDTENITDIYYTGTEAEWKEIENSTTIPSYTTVHYQSTIAGGSIGDSEEDTNGTEVASVTMLTSLDLESDILSYGTYGKWKENVPLSIEVDGVRTELPKDGSSVSVTFKNEDIVKFFASDVQLYSGIASVTNLEDGAGMVDVVSHDTSSTSEVIYTITSNSQSKTLIVSARNQGTLLVSGSWSGKNIVYDLTALTSEGKPLQGISMTDNSFTNNDYTYYGILSYKEKEKITWGNGNSLYYEIGEDWSLKGNLVKATDEKGYTDSCVVCTPEYEYVTELPFGSNFAIRYGEAHEICATKTVFVNNGLVDIDTEYMGKSGDQNFYATFESLGISSDVASTVIPNTDEKGILGDYYHINRIENDELETGTDSLILKDETGAEIATIEINNFQVKGNIKEKYYLIGAEGNGREECLITMDVNIKMADGMDDWNVTTNFSDDVFHINAVKTVSSDNGTTEDNTTQTPNKSYEVTLPSNKTEITSKDFATILTENKTKDVVIKSNDKVTFTFKKGTMSSVEGMENYDFGTNIISDFASVGEMSSAITKDNFISRIHFNYSGKLPAEASIKIYVGTHLVGKTLYYSQILENGFRHIQFVVVDGEGYITVKQSHCSDYVVTTEKVGTDESGNTDNNESDNNDKTEEETSPNTGDTTQNVLYSIVALVVAVLLAAVMQKRKNNC